MYQLVRVLKDKPVIHRIAEDVKLQIEGFKPLMPIVKCLRTEACQNLFLLGLRVSPLFQIVDPPARCVVVLRGCLSRCITSPSVFPYPVKISILPQGPVVCSLIIAPLPRKQRSKANLHCANSSSHFSLLRYMPYLSQTPLRCVTRFPIFLLSGLFLQKLSGCQTTIFSNQKQPSLLITDFCSSKCQWGWGGGWGMGEGQTPHPVFEQKNVEPPHLVI